MPRVWLRNSRSALRQSAAIAALHHGLTLPVGASAGVKGGWLAPEALHRYPSEMAQNFCTAIFAWTDCFLVTILASLVTRAHPESKLSGLVHSLTARSQTEGLPWYGPGILALVVLAMALILNLIFA